MGFTKLDANITNSSLMGEDTVTKLVWVLMLSLADKNGVVDIPHDALARRFNEPLEDVRRAIATLEAPDPTSRSPAEEGRRLVRLDEHRDWGWLLVNHKMYRDSRDEEGRREYKTRWQANRRALDKGESPPYPEVLQGDQSPQSPPKSTVDAGGRRGPMQKQMQMQKADAEEEDLKTDLRPSPAAGAGPNEGDSDDRDRDGGRRGRAGGEAGDAEHPGATASDQTGGVGDTEDQAAGNDRGSQERSGQRRGDALLADECLSDGIADRPASPGDGGRAVESTFAEIWAAYPKKRGKAKALRKWKRMGATRPAVAEVLAFIEAGKKSREWTKDDGEYIPNGSTFFNGELWADGPDSFRSNGGSPAEEDPFDYDQEPLTLRCDSCGGTMEAVSTANIREGARGVDCPHCLNSTTARPIAEKARDATEPKESP